VMQSRKPQLEAEEKEHTAEPEASEGREVDHRPSGTSWARRWLAVSALAVLALLAVTYLTTRSRVVDATPRKIGSLAVLPLKNLSSDPAQDYFADGMTEAIIGRLAVIRGLRVTSRTSVMRFKDTHASVPEITKTLGVSGTYRGGTGMDTACPGARSACGVRRQHRVDFVPCSPL
jgi:hypothetical protein